MGSNQFSPDSLRCGLRFPIAGFPTGRTFMKRILGPFVGEKFNRLTVIAESFSTVRGKNKIRRCLCRCDCGAEKVVDVFRLRNNVIQSCGCLMRQRLSENRSRTDIKHVTHGALRLVNIIEGRIWSGMVQRCTNPNAPAYKHYGGRGIYVCDRWLGDSGFVNFLADMGRRPSKRYSLGRINNNGPYSPENCRWETAIQQARNKRTSHLVTVNGVTKCVSEWAGEFGICRNLVYRRLESGFDNETAIMAPVGTLNKEFNEQIKIADNMKSGDSVLFENLRLGINFYNTLRRLGFKAVRRQDGNGMRIWKMLK